jgi:hypothetical protein
MPNNYKETTVAGEETNWKRISRIIINNVYAMLPNMLAKEDAIIRMPSGKTVIDSSEELRATYQGPECTWPLLNPETDEVIGEGNDALLMTVLYSKTRAMQVERDSKNATPPAE